MNDQQIDFQPLRDEGLSEIDEKTLGVFESALESISEATLEEKARSVATELKKLVPMNLSGEEAETLLEGLWELLIGIAKHVPYRHDGQILLVRIVTNLDAPDEAMEKVGHRWTFAGITFEHHLTSISRRGVDRGRVYLTWDAA